MRVARILALPMVLFSLAACGDDDKGPTGPQISEFAGVWNATSITYTSKGTPTKTLNIVPLGGALSMNISSNGTFTGTFKVPGQPEIPMTGTVTLQANNQAAIDFTWPGPLQQNPPISDFTATYVRSGNNLSFTRPETTFAFPPSTTAEAASLVIAMVRT